MGAVPPDIEVCGVLVGNVYHDDHGPYLYVEAQHQRRKTPPAETRK